MSVDAAARRQAIVTGLLPGLIVAAAYVLLLRPRDQAAAARAQDELRKVREDAPDPHQVQQAFDDVERIRQALDEFRLKQREHQDGVSSPTAMPREGAGALSAIVARNRLVVIDERIVVKEGSNRQARVLRVAGGYSDVLRALDDVAREITSGRLLEVEMVTTRGTGGAPTWTLTIG